MNARLCDLDGHGSARHGRRVEVEERLECLEHGWDPTRPVQILDQVFAGRPDVGEDGCLGRKLVEAVERQRHAGPSCDCE